MPDPAVGAERQKPLPTQLREAAEYVVEADDTATAANWLRVAADAIESRDALLHGAGVDHAALLADRDALQESEAELSAQIVRLQNEVEDVIRDRDALQERERKAAEMLERIAKLPHISASGGERRCPRCIAADALAALGESAGESK